MSVDVGILTSLLSISTSSGISSDVSSAPSSLPTSIPPTSIDTSVSSSSVPTSIPPSSSSDITSLPSSSDVSSTVSSTSSQSPTTTTTPLTTAFFSPTDIPAATVNFTTIVTSISGQLTTFTSALPTALVSDNTPSNSSTSHRTTLIAATTSGLFAFLLLLLWAVFAYRRHNLRRSLANLTKKREVKALLEGEEFDDDDVVPMSMRHHRDLASNPYQQRSGSPSGSPNPSLLKSRTSESGSIFREEVWPPPGFADPIHKRSSQVDLSKIVDDVMGPSPPFAGSSSGAHYYVAGAPPPPSSWHNRDFTDVTMTSSQSDLSMNSTTSIRRTSSNSDPFQTPLAGPNSIYEAPALPPGASAPNHPGSSNQSANSHSTESSPPHSSSSHSTYPLYTTPAVPVSRGSHTHTRSTSSNTPKKSSPLSRVLHGDARTWLGRS